MGVIDEESCDKDYPIKNDCLLLKLIIQHSNFPKDKEQPTKDLTGLDVCLWNSDTISFRLSGALWDTEYWLTNMDMDKNDHLPLENLDMNSNTEKIEECFLYDLIQIALKSGKMIFLGISYTVSPSEVCCSDFVVKNHDRFKVHNTINFTIHIHI